MAKTKRCVCIINPKTQLKEDKLLHYPTFSYLYRKKGCHYMPWSENRISAVWEIVAYHNFLTSKNIEIFQAAELANNFNLETHK